MLMPPRMRQVTKTGKLCAKAMPMEERTKFAAARIKDRFAAKAVAERAGHQRSRQAAQQRAALRPTGGRNRVRLHLRPEARVLRHQRRRVFEVEEGFVELGGAANDHPVVAEEQPAHRGDDGDRPYVAGIKAGAGPGSRRRCIRSDDHVLEDYGGKVADDWQPRLPAREGCSFIALPSSFIAAGPRLKQLCISSRHRALGLSGNHRQPARQRMGVTRLAGRPFASSGFISYRYG